MEIKENLKVSNGMYVVDLCPVHPTYPAVYKPTEYCSGCHNRWLLKQLVKAANIRIADYVKP